MPLMVQQVIGMTPRRLSTPRCAKPVVATKTECCEICLSPHVGSRSGLGSGSKRNTLG